MAPPLTTIVGALYDAQTGDKRTSGRLLIRPKAHFAVGKDAVCPVIVTVDIPSSGNLSFYLVPSSTPYVVEFDPDPADSLTPLALKKGYFKNEWLVPATGPVAIETL